MTTDLAKIPIHRRGRRDIHRRKAAEAQLTMDRYWARWEQGLRWCSRCHGWTSLSELSPLRGTPCRRCRRSYQNAWTASRAARRGQQVRLTMRGCDSAEEALAAMGRLAELLAIYDDEGRAPPRRRGACPTGPCPWVRCRYHLYFDLSEEGLLSIHQPGAALAELEHTCALTAAEGGEMTLDAIGALLNLSRERVRQVEDGALRRLARALEEDEGG